NEEKKIIIFSEWVRMNGLIGRLLRELGVNYVELNGKVPVPKRQALVNRFYDDPACKVFLSTEAGGTGLNLQVADTVINFELPWNPAKKNQRIGRIDRIGQQAKSLTVINLITQNSIEERIAAGLILKENLFENVLDQDSVGDSVDFSQKGRAQFLKQIETAISGIEVVKPSDHEAFIEEEIINKRKETLAADLFQEEGVFLEEEVIIQDETERVETIIQEEEDTLVHDLTPPERKEEEKEDPIPAFAHAAATTTPEPHTAESTPTTSETTTLEDQGALMADVMNQGMGFLSGMFKMMTGQDLGVENQKIEVDTETGEVVMRFKMPVQGKGDS
ncbi:MAG: C-terminal helicase domain-containing protein, partial [Bacteroidota bacterium]